MYLLHFAKIMYYFSFQLFSCSFSLYGMRAGAGVCFSDPFLTSVNIYVFWCSQTMCIMIAKHTLYFIEKLNEFFLLFMDFYICEFLKNG